MAGQAFMRGTQWTVLSRVKVPGSQNMSLRNRASTRPQTIPGDSPSRDSATMCHTPSLPSHAGVFCSLHPRAGADDFGS
jgi:hypothetical protein